MKAGRELDALIAEKVMGEDYREFSNGRARVSRPPDGEYLGRVPSYSTDIAAAWPVFEKVGGKLFRDSVNGRWYLEDVAADTAPLAICLAALKAVGVEV